MQTNPVLIFAGTTEGRQLAERLEASQIECIACVATEYGRQLMKPSAFCRVHTGRLTPQQMEALMKKEQVLVVVDATHPYAVEVSKNIRSAAQQLGLSYLRLKRQDACCGNRSDGEKDIFYVNSHEECAKALAAVSGNILLTTGSKNLACYAKEEQLRRRLYVRVLPSQESIRLCEEQGITGKQIIAMQGPISKEMNEQMIKEFAITCMVTKESGVAGGYPEKKAAAETCAIPLFVIENPGVAFEKPESEAGDVEICDAAMVLEKIASLTGKAIQKNTTKLVLAGMGMGNEGLLTTEVREKIRQADILFGAKRLLEAIPGGLNEKAIRKDFYLAADILPYIKEQQEKCVLNSVCAVVLFSGDTGFYSGAQKLFDAARSLENINCRICPGISSVSYLSARAGICWQDAKIMSIHGTKQREETAERTDIAKVVREVRAHSKVVLITSGVADMQELGKSLIEQELSDVKLTVGFCLSYPKEQIMVLTPQACMDLTKEGLYTCIIENADAAKTLVLPGLSEEAFIRDRVPMTKEEVREVSICKLRPGHNAVVYDIGSGTGSVAVELARLSEDIKVYAIEKKPLAISLIRQNCERYHLKQVTVIEGEAPACLKQLPAPTHVFIGGSGGNLMQILETLYQKNKSLRIVANAVTLETIAELTTCLKKFPVKETETVQLSVSRAKEVGAYHLMQAENPVYIVAFEFMEGECDADS